jgi:hypothetical protein
MRTSPVISIAPYRLRNLLDRPPRSMLASCRSAPARGGLLARSPAQRTDSRTNPAVKNQSKDVAFYSGRPRPVG